MSTENESVLSSELRTNVDGYYDSLVTKFKDDIIKLPEKIFVHFFLPFFCSERKLEEDPSIISVWIGIAGAPTKEVQIVDDNNLILFNVPSMMNTSVIDTLNKNSSQNFMNIVNNYELYKTVTPQRGKNYLDNAIDEKIEKLRLTSNVFIDNEKRWKDIFIRYGKIKKNVEDKNIINNNKLSDEEFSYD